MGFRQGDSLKITCLTAASRQNQNSWGRAKLLIIVVFNFIITLSTKAQTPTQIVAELKNVNNKVASMPCNAGKGMLISNKAMNIFLSNKVSSYLSDGTDLSLYKNYVNLSAVEGRLSISHNFHQPVDSDDYVRSFIIIGARVNVANTYTARFSNRHFDNQLGFTLQKTWMGKPVMRFDGCGNQKLSMDAQRAALLHNLEAEIERKAADFERTLDSIKQEEIPGQDMAKAKGTLKHNFYTALRLEYLQKFSEKQSDLLIQTNNYNLITDNWTIFGVYIPVIRQKYQVGTDLHSDVRQRYNYPFEVFLTHTRFYESSRYGRFFFTLNAKGVINNSIQSGTLYYADVSGLPVNSGTGMVAVNEGDRYIGNYTNFFTPVTAAKLVYIPRESHVGISFRIEKNYGNYHAFNSILGIPIVLIDKKGVPAINFECQLLFSDMNNTIKNRLTNNKTFVGLTVGIPFSKIVY